MKNYLTMKPLSTFQNQKQCFPSLHMFQLAQIQPHIGGQIALKPTTIQLKLATIAHPNTTTAMIDHIDPTLLLPTLSYTRTHCQEVSIV